MLKMNFTHLMHQTVFRSTSRLNKAGWVIFAVKEANVNHRNPLTVIIHMQFGIIESSNVHNVIQFDKKNWHARKQSVQKHGLQWVPSSPPGMEKSRGKIDHFCTRAAFDTAFLLAFWTPASIACRNVRNVLDHCKRTFKVWIEQDPIHFSQLISI